MTGTLFSAPRYIPVSNTGVPRAGAKLYFYRAGTSTLANVYTTSACTTPHTSPVVASASGQFAAIYLNPAAGHDYKAVLQTSAGVQVWSEDNIPASVAPIYAQTAAESSVTIVDATKAPGNVLRYGLNSNPGVTDMTAAIQAAINSNSAVYIPAGTYRTTSALTLLSDLTIYGDGAASIISAAADINIITGTSKSDIVLRDFAIVGASSTAATDAVQLTGCSNVHVLRLDISGVSDQGVIAQAGSVNVTVEGCYFHGWQQKEDDSADISFYNNCTYSRAINNRCEGGGDHGIRFQLTSNDNLAQGNTVTAHARYGILAGYETVGNEKECRNKVIGNTVKSITGLGLIGGDARAGAGIYCVYVGGVTIADNYVYDTNTGTANETLNPSGIAVSAPYSECIVTGNTVVACNWYGIGVFTNTFGAHVEVSNNTVRNCDKIGIYVKNHDHVTVIGNTVTNTATAAVDGIKCYGEAADITHIQVIGNWLRGGTGGMVTGVWLENVNEFTVSGNHVEEPQGRGVHIIACDDGSIGPNTVRSAVTAGLRFGSGCNRIAAVGGHYDSDGTYSMEASGTGTALTASDVYINPEVISNAAESGLAVTYRAAAAPASGTWRAGDTVYYRTPTAGGNIGEVCTTSGTIGSGAVFKTFGAVTA